MYLKQGTLFSKIMSFSLIMSLTLSASSVWAERVDPQLELQPIFESDASPSPEAFTSVQELNASKADNPAEETLIPTLRGGVELDKEFVPDVTFQPAEQLPKGEKLILGLMDFVATGYSQPGDEFHARVKVQVERNGKILIPKGTLIKGHIKEIEQPGNALSKRGRLVLAFEHVLMADGRKIPFKTEYGKGDHGLKKMGRAVAGGIGGTLSGAIEGVLVGLSFGGIPTAVATHGATLIGGGGLGALSGLGKGIARSGDHVYLNEGDTIKVVLKEPLALPGMILAPDTQNEIHAAGLDVQITGYTLERDPFKVENQIGLKLAINNQTAHAFGSFDVALVDEYNTLYYVSPFAGESMLVFQLKPNSQLEGELAFSVKNPDAKHYLIFYKPYTREVIAKVSLTEALKKLSQAPKAKRPAST